MAEEKKPEADKNCPIKMAAAPRRTKAKIFFKTGSKMLRRQIRRQKQQIKSESQKEQIKETVSHKEEKVMTQEA